MPLSGHPGNCKCYHCSWLKWIVDSGDWPVLTTLTFDLRRAFLRPSGMPFVDFARKEFKKFCNSAARRAGEHLDVFWCTEKQLRGVVHYHAIFKPLEGSQKVLSAKDFEELWEHGLSKIEKPRCLERVIEYLLKHSYWDRTIACERRKRCRKQKGCRTTKIKW